MKETKEQKSLALGKQNLIMLLAALLMIIIGFTLMLGSSVEVEYNPDIFSFRRLTLGPMIALAGFFTVILAILWKPKKEKE